MIIREAVTADVEALISLGCKLVDDLLDLRSDRQKIRRMITTSISSSAHLLLIAEEDKELVGAIIVGTETFSFAEKMYGTIAGFHYKSPDVGGLLIKVVMQWIHSRKAVQLVTYTMPVKTDVDRLLLEHDFESTGSMLIWRRYGISK